jgi:hypothetical protein
MGKIMDATNLATCNWHNPGTGAVRGGRHLPERGNAPLQVA